jgi:hypothetical protein
MRLNTLFGGASPYVHLAGLVPARGRRAEDDKPADEPKGKKSKAADDDDDGDDDDQPKGKTSRADDDPDQYPEDDDSAPKGKRSKAADDDDAGDDGDDDAPKGKKSRAEDDDDPSAEDDDDDKEEMSGKSAAALARRRERARCKAIFSHPAAAENLPLAASLAFDTAMTRAEALAVLKGQEGRGGDRGGRSARARHNADLGPIGESRMSGKQQIAASWAQAFKRAGVPAKGK